MAAIFKLNEVEAQKSNPSNLYYLVTIVPIYSRSNSGIHFVLCESSNFQCDTMYISFSKSRCFDTDFSYSMVRNEGRVDMIDLINGILGSLVSITAGCFLYRAWEAMLIGAIGAFLTCITMPMFDKWAVDDPVGAR